MENFINWLYNNFSLLISNMTERTVAMIQLALRNSGEEVEWLHNININLVLFSETPILITNLYDFLLVVFSIFYSVIFVVIVYKIIKKVVVKITRWNRW